MHMHGARRRRLLITSLTALALAAATLVAGAPAGATAGDIGYRDQSYSGASNPPTSDKPQSKLWYNDGFWWATMFDTLSKTWHIFRLNRATQSWVDTGTQVDNRPQTLSDALWDGQKLYIASQWATVSSQTSAKVSVAGRPARLYRYSYDAALDKYSLDAGFPANINNSSSESLTIDKDSTGKLWATWTQVSGSSTAGYINKVYVNSSTTSDAVWGTPQVLPVTGASTATPDDLSGVVAFAHDRIGVMWSNQTDNTMYWAVHRDGAGPDAWLGSVAVRGPMQADDHMNLKSILSDDAGRVFAATKTSLDELAGAPRSSPQLRLLVFRPGTGSWSSTTVGTLDDCHTRPQVVLDDEHQLVHVFATAPTSSGCPFAGSPGTIYEKTAPMADPVFPAGRGTPVIRDAASANMNDVTTTKQVVSSSTGLVVLAVNTSTKRYWHADIPLSTTPPPPVAPVSSFTASPTSGAAPLTVQLTDTSTNSPTSWAWDFGNGSTSTVQNPSVTYDAAGSYTITLRASNDAGTGAAATRTIDVSPVPPPPTGISRASVSTATSITADTGLTIAAPAGTQTGDLLVTCLALNGSTLAAAPAGWTRVAAPTGVTNPRVYGYYRVAGSAEPASYRWTFAASVTSGGGTARYTGAKRVDGTASTATGAAATSATVPGVTTSVAGDMLVGCLGVNSGATTLTITGPSSLAEAWDIGGKRNELDDGVQAAAGPSGPMTWQLSSGREWAGWLLALTP